jgi:hypothetical protein
VVVVVVLLLPRCRMPTDAVRAPRTAGDDADVRALSFVMDSTAFPFYQAEPYHQYHDGFAWGEDYPNSYNNLAKAKVKAGLIKDGGCPNGMLGVGVLGL